MTTTSSLRDSSHAPEMTKQLFFFLLLKSDRSANFNNVTGECRLSDMDRHTMAGTGAFRTSSSNDYMENNCVDDPVKLCEFQKLDGRILKTVNSIFQDVASIDDCRQLCLTAPYRCHSFDYADTGENVCRLSHHALATLTHIQVR